MTFITSYLLGLELWNSKLNYFTNAYMKGYQFITHISLACVAENINGKFFDKLVAVSSTLSVATNGAVLWKYG